jgi:hypothetical protein
MAVDLTRAVYTVERPALESVDAVYSTRVRAQKNSALLSKHVATSASNYLPVTNPFVIFHYWSIAEYWLNMIGEIKRYYFGLFRIFLCDWFHVLHVLVTGPQHHALRCAWKPTWMEEIFTS